MPLNSYLTTDELNAHIKGTGMNISEVKNMLIK